MAKAYDPVRLKLFSFMADPGDMKRLKALTVKQRTHSVSALIRKAIAELLEREAPDV